MASGTSKETEIKLTNVARASLEELQLEYEDFLRPRNLELWDIGSKYTERLGQLNRTPNANYNTFKKGIENADPAICANILIGLIKITTYLLSRQLKVLEAAFLYEGGLRERMKKARIAHRNKGN